MVILTSTQLATLKAWLLANASNLDEYQAAAALNATASPSFTVFKTAVALDLIGKAFVADGVAAISSANVDRLTAFAHYNPGGINPSRADQRQFFEDVFAVSAGAATRTALQALWRRLATEGEKIFATGAGSDADPATLVVEGSFSEQNVIDALR